MDQPVRPRPEFSCVKIERVKIMSAIRALPFVLLMLLWSAPANAAKKEHPPSEKTYEATSADKVFVALVRSAGATLVSQVKEACVVNFKPGHQAGNYYTWLLTTATCRDAGDGKITVTLQVQMQSNQLFGAGGFRDKTVTEFWAAMDHELGAATR